MKYLLLILAFICLPLMADPALVIQYTKDGIPLIVAGTPDASNCEQIDHGPTMCLQLGRAEYDDQGSLVGYHIVMVATE